MTQDLGHHPRCTALLSGSPAATHASHARGGTIGRLTWRKLSSGAELSVNGCHSYALTLSHCRNTYCPALHLRRQGSVSAMRQN